MADRPADHVALVESARTARYFAKFRAISAHLPRVSAMMRAEGRLSSVEVDVLTRYLAALGYSFEALAMKYRLTGRDIGHALPSLEIDIHESGFPVAAELLVMAYDAVQAQAHLNTSASPETLKEEMVREIVSQRRVPRALQFALSQRLYYEELARGALFWARNDPQVQWLEGLEPRRTYLIHWAAYDSTINLPVIYLMEVVDSGRPALPKDERRWPEVQAHLSAQALAGLKLVTIARGFDERFDDLHPKRLRRFHIGPMYSHAYTRQSGPLREVLETAHAPEGQDWALAWTDEVLEAGDVRHERSGLFGRVERQVYTLDPTSGAGGETGATRTARSVILPQRPYQVLEEHAPPGFAAVRKYVVSPAGRVLSYG